MRKILDIAKNVYYVEEISVTLVNIDFNVIIY